MSEFPSWFESKDGKDAIFLIDKDIERVGMDINNDVIGHSAIKKVFAVPKNYIECELYPCHPMVAEAIRSGRMNRMMKVVCLKVNVNEKGEREGLWEQYYKNGQLREKGNYKNDKLEGWGEWYYENGQLAEKTNYKKDKREGLWEWYYENGQLSEKTNYKNDKLEGWVEWYYENGQLKEKRNYKNDKPEGLCERYYENGQLAEKTNYKNGKRVG